VKSKSPLLSVNANSFIECLLLNQISSTRLVFCRPLRIPLCRHTLKTLPLWRREVAATRAETGFSPSLPEKSAVAFHLSLVTDLIPCRNRAY
jgi:hypothetical protein